MLKYIQESKSENAKDDATRKIDGYVKHVKDDPLWKEGAMTLGYYIDRECEEASKKQRIDDILELLEDCGPISDGLRERLNEINDPDILKGLLKLAARTDNISDFINALPQSVTVSV